MLLFDPAAHQPRDDALIRQWHFSDAPARPLYVRCRGYFRRQMLAASISLFDATRTYSEPLMHGNVWEWVEDPWHASYEGAPADGSAWLTESDPTYRVVRSGSWRNDTELIRSAVRAKRHVNVRFDTLGFRIARTVDR
jgi:formylglycine-generating enzyme required for sulfatase activity